MDRMPLSPESFFEGTPPHVRAYIEQLHTTIANLHSRMAERSPTSLFFWCFSLCSL
jgi:hypothetical protein